MLVGLQLRGILDRLSTVSAAHLATWGALTAGAVAAIRLVWVYPSTYVPRWAFPRIRARGHRRARPWRLQLPQQALPRALRRRRRRRARGTVAGLSASDARPVRGRAPGARAAARRGLHQRRRHEPRAARPGPGGQPLRRLEVKLECRPSADGWPEPLGSAFGRPRSG